MKLLTWNSQGARLRAYEWRLQQYKPDIMVVQECGNLPNVLGVAADDDRDPQKVGAIDGYNVWWIAWNRTGPGGNGNLRCSIAMLFQDGGGPTALLSNDDFKRPVIRKNIGSYCVYNIHAGGLDYIDEAITSARIWGSGKTFVVAGDFNQDPDTIRQRYGRAVNVIEPGKPTRPASKRTLDYAVTDGTGTAELNPSYHGSDHIAVNISIT